MSESPPQIDPTRPRLRPMLTCVAAVACGAWLASWTAERWDDGLPAAIAFLLPVALIPPLRRRFVAALDALREPSRRTRLAVALALVALAALHSYLQAIRVGRNLQPTWQDEFSYLLQATHLARGRLWYPPHPMADFFESFQMFAKPVYGSMYWPGAALMNVPGRWLGLPTYAMPMLIFGGAVAAIYLLAGRLLDGVAGLAAAAMAVKVLDYADFSSKVMAQIPVTLLAAGLLWAWLNWRQNKRLRWAAAMGGLAGWLLICRPVDALAFTLPVAAAVVIALGRNWRRLTRTAGVTALAALPFVTIQLVQNYGMTGSLLRPAYYEYLRLNQPGATFGGLAGTADAPPPPQTTLPQKLDYNDWLVGLGRRYRAKGAVADLLDNRLPTLFVVALPGRNFYAWAVLGALAAFGVYGRLPTPRDARRPLLLMLGVVALFLTLYALNPFFLGHYALPLAAVTLPLCAAGLRALEESAGTRLRPYLVTLLSGGMILWLGFYIQAFPLGRYDTESLMTFTGRDVPRQVAGRALILVYYGPPGSGGYEEEPVYNPLVARPDDARIVWAHDLGGRDGEILRYYAARQPDRQVYLLVRPKRVLIPLGDVPAALKSFEAGDWPDRAKVAASTQPILPRTP